MTHLLYQGICIVIGCCKQGIIPVQEFSGHTTVKFIAVLNKAVEPVDCIQVEKAPFFFRVGPLPPWLAVPGGAAVGDMQDGGGNLRVAALRGH